MIKAINKNVLNILNTLDKVIRVYCEKSVNRNRHYYTVLLSTLSDTEISKLKSLLKEDKSIKSIIIKYRDFIRISVYFKSDRMNERQRFVVKG
jgi:hypothetical protein